MSFNVAAHILQVEIYSHIETHSHRTRTARSHFTSGNLLSPSHIVTRRNDLVVERRLRRKKRGGKRIRRVSGFSTPFLRGQIAEFRKKTKEKRERGSQRRDGGVCQGFPTSFSQKCERMQSNFSYIYYTQPGHGEVHQWALTVKFIV